MLNGNRRYKVAFMRLLQQLS